MSKNLGENSIIDTSEIMDNETDACSLQEELAALELQLKIFKQAEKIGDIGNWQINLNSFQTTFSDNLFRLYGLEISDKAHPDLFIPFIHPDDRKVISEAFEKSYSEKIPLHLEFRIVRPDGEVRHFAIVSSVTKNYLGEPLLTGITQDITEKKFLEIKLRESVEKIYLQNEVSKQAEQIGFFGTWQINLSTRQNLYSENLFRIFGLKGVPRQPGFDLFVQLVQIDDRPLFDELVKTILAGNQPADTEFRIVRPDGKLRNIRLKGKLFHNEENEFLVVCVMQDITNPVQKEEALRETSERLNIQNISFQQAEVTAGIGSWTWDINSDKIYFSNNYCALFGLKQVGASNFDPFINLIHPEDRNWMKDMPARLKKELKEQDFRFRVIRADGELRFLRSRNQPHLTPQGNINIIGTTQDITDEVLLHQQVKEKTQFSEMLAEHIQDEILVTDNSNNIIACNQMVELKHHLKKEEALGKNIFELFPQLKNKQVIEAFQKALSGETIQFSEFKTIMGGECHEYTLVPVRNSDEHVIAVLSIQHDITEQYNLQRDLEDRLEFIGKLVESSVNRIAVLDRNLNYLYWNKKNEIHFDLNKQEVIGKNIFEVFPDFRNDQSYLGLKKAISGETVHLPVNRNSGTKQFDETYLIPIKGNREEIIAVLWMVNDLTEIIEAENKIKDRDFLLSKTAEASPDAIVIFENETKKTLYLNSILMDWIGFSNAQLGEMSIKQRLELIHSDDRERVMDFNEKMNSAEDDEVRTLEYRLIKQDGDFIWIRNRSRVFQRLEDGSVFQVLAVLQNITKSKLAEEEVKKQQALLKQAEEISHLGSYELDLITNDFYWSDEMFRIYGYAPQSFKPTLDFYVHTTHPEDQPKTKESIQNLDNADNYQIHQRIYTVDGRIRFLISIGKFFRNQHGKLAKLIGTAQDITSQMEMEEALREKTAIIKLQQSVEKQVEKIRQSGSWQWDLKTGQAIWAKNTYKLLGVEPFIFEPSIESFIQLIHPDDQKHIREKIKDVIDHHPKEAVFEFRAIVMDEIRHFRASSVMVRGIGGSTMVGSLMDVTTDVILREQLEEKNRRLEEMNEELTSFAFIASHDLREPLRKIKVFTERIESKEIENLSEIGLDHFRRIRNSVQRMDQLIDDILSFSAINEANKKWMEFDLEDVLKNVLSDLSQMISDRNARVEYDKLPVIWGDPSHFYHLWLNLINNGIKYQEAGKQPVIKISSRILKGSDLKQSMATRDPSYLEIEVSDNGIGFEQQYERKIFQMFQRLHGMHEYNGTGMGLAICKKVVEIYNGFITTVSSPGQGASFHCYFRLDSRS